MIKLKDFKNQLSDFARPNRFTVEVYIPSTIGIDTSKIEIFTWTAQSASIPSRSQGEVSIKFHGMELKLPGDYSKQNLSITFLNDYDFVGKSLIEKWMEFGGQRVADNNEKTYAANMLGATIVVNQKGRTDVSSLASYKFYDVFPISMSAIDLDMTNTDQIEKFTVDFSYSYFENLDMYEE
jgi:hypothetical protein